MLKSVKYNLSHLLDFGGRDARATFWFYVLFLFLVNIVVGIVLGFVLIGSLMGPVFVAARAGASEEAMQAQLATQMGGFMGTILWYSLIATIVMVVLLAASFVRRLHDSNRSGWWGLLVLAAQAGSFYVSIRMMGMMQELMTEAMSRTSPMSPLEMQALMQNNHMSAYGAVGWIAPLIVIVFGVMDSTEGPNRYGGEPVRF
jgi:uncharacterized membrane protein YhaH (DUF805 family)